MAMTLLCLLELPTVKPPPPLLLPSPRLLLSSGSTSETLISLLLILAASALKLPRLTLQSWLVIPMMSSLLVVRDSAMCTREDMRRGRLRSATDIAAAGNSEGTEGAEHWHNLPSLYAWIRTAHCTGIKCLDGCQHLCANPCMSPPTSPT